MPKNLRSKVMNLLDDLETLNRYEAAERIEDLVKKEIKYLESEHLIGKYDINLVKSKAIDKYNSIDFRRFPKGTDLDYIRTWCYIESVVSFLKSKGLISFTVKDKDFKHE